MQAKPQQSEVKHKPTYKDHRADATTVEVRKTEICPGRFERTENQTRRAIDSFFHATKGVVREATRRARFEGPRDREKRKRKTADQFHKGRRD